jgi:4-hydroxyphenylpyruvate dioxygenase
MVHGDGVKVIALEVDDVEKAWQATTSRGGKSAWAPREEKDDHGIYRTSAIYTYGETLHVFVDRGDYKGVFAPTYKPLKYETESTGLAAIDHIVGNVQLGKMNHWVNFYHQVMGFRQLMHFDDKDISTEYSALMSKVMQNGNGRVKFPINEPAEGKRKSQIEEYLDYYLTPGAQHLAIITGDILTTIEKLRKNGVEFLRVPDTYYEMLPDRIGTIKEDYKAIQELGILVDKDDEGYLLQIFTAPFKTAPPCSSKSSNATAHKASAKATSKHCSNHSNSNRNAAATCHSCPLGMLAKPSTPMWNLFPFKTDLAFGTSPSMDRLPCPSTTTKCFILSKALPATENTTSQPSCPSAPHFWQVTRLHNTQPLPMASPLIGTTGKTPKRT